MANRRMFARSVTESDEFLDLSHNAQLLWFHMGMAADDEGFINSMKRIITMCDIESSALKELIDSGFVIAFGSGVYVIRDWHVNNKIRSDRRNPTRFQEEAGRITLNDDDRYSLAPEGF